MENESKPKYVIETAYQHEALAAQVCEKIRDGYTPCGGPWTSGSATHQALHLPATVSVEIERNWVGGPL